MRLFCTWVLLFLSIVGALVAQSDSFAMQPVLQRYTEAYGVGRDAYALSSMSIEGTQELGGQVYDFLLQKKRPNSIRYRLTHGEKSVVTAYDGIAGWTQSEENGRVTTRKLTREERIALKQEAIFEGPLFRHQERRSNKVEMVGREQVEGREVYVFKTQEASGRRSLYYLDAREPHILKVERLGADDVVETTIMYRGYKEIEGYPFAFEVETRVGEEVVSLVKIDSISPNAGLLSYYFRMPK